MIVGIKFYHGIIGQFRVKNDDPGNYFSCDGCENSFII